MMFKKKILSRVVMAVLFASGLSIPLLSQGNEAGSVNSVTQKPSPLLHDSNIVGNLAGSFAVDQSGNATYDIPVKMSPGTAGMAPTLSIHYDSSGGNGVLGMGFSLQGLTAITRTPQNYVQNGQIHGIDFTNNDRFALNGQQLVAVAGGAYGADNTEYRTYIDSQSRIVSHGAQGNGPAYFSVQTKGGQTAYYASGSDAAVLSNDANESAHTVVSWQLSKIVDAAGNYINYHYDVDAENGMNYVSEIDYTGNDGESLTPYAKIKFIYETRPDAVLAYQAGSKFNLTRRLIEVQSYYKDDLVYDYKFHYELSPNTSRTRLTSISQCDGSGQCLRPLTFNWQTNEAGWVEAPQWAPPEALTYFNSNGVGGAHTSDDTGARFINAYGNGLPELVVSRAPIMNMLIPSNYTDQVGYNNAWKPAMPSCQTSCWQSDSQFKPAIPLSFAVQVNPACKYGVTLSDVSGSGRDTLLQGFSFGKTVAFFKAYDATDQGWAASSNKILPRNINFGWLDAKIQFANLLGDGHLAVLESIDETNGVMPTGKYTYEYTGSGWEFLSAYVLPRVLARPANALFFADSGLNFLDLTGSGRDDLMIANDSERLTWMNTGDSTGGQGSAWKANPAFNPPDHFRFVVNGGNGTEDGGGRAVSLLGDGLTDLIMGRGGDHEAWINTGKRFIAAPSYNPPTSIAYDNGHGYDNGVALIDVTGNGLPDFLQCSASSNGGNCQAWLNENGAWVQHDEYKLPVQISDAYGNDNGVRFVDLFGTGFMDIVMNNGNRQDAWLNKAQTKPDVITNIQDALNDNLQIQYKPITDTSVYTKGSSSTYPNMDYQGPLYVVAKTSSDTNVTPIPAIPAIKNKLAKLINASQIQHVTDYHYANAVINHLGWGLLGFGSMTTTDEKTGISITTTYSQDITNHTQGIPTSSVTQLANGTILNKQSATFDTKIFGSKQLNQTYYLPYVKTSTEDAYDLNGAHLSTKTTTTTLDDFANPTEILQTATDNTGAYTTDTKNTYTNDTDNGHWFIGELTVANVTASAPNTLSMIHATSFTYDPATGMLQTTTTYAGTPPALRARPHLKFYDDSNWLTKSYKRDAYGNIIQTDITGSNIAPRSQSVVYDDQNQYRFVKTQINALGQEVQYTYDSDFGNLKTVTDANNQTLTNDYDSFGRLQTIHHPDSTTSQVQYQWTQDDTSAPPGSVYKIIETQTGSPTKISYHDELDREIAQAMQGFSGKWIWQFTYYDELGRVVGKTNPVYAGDKIYATSNEYDVLGRVTKTINTDGTIIQLQYSGYSTTTTNPNNQQTTKIVNVRGNLIQSMDAQNHVTQYQYDAFDHLIQLQDSQGHLTTMQYDNLGNKLNMNDLDRGHWNYSYDMLGEMLTQTDPLNHQTSFQYDNLGRLISRTDPAGTSTWQYDTAINGVGKLAEENGVSNIVKEAIGKTKNGTSIVKQFNTKPTSAQVLKAAEDNLVSYSRSYTYDNLSRPDSMTTNINGQAYTQKTSYNSIGRVDVITDPNGIKTKNVYDDYGYVTKIIDPDSAIVYSTVNAMDAAGHATSVTHSNGLITNYTYDPATNFLTEILTQPTQTLDIQRSLFPSENKNRTNEWHLKQVASSHLLPRPLVGEGWGEGNAVQKLDYQYDNLGNITDKDDPVLNIHDHYTYDELNRLTSNNTLDKAHNQTSTQSFAYDELGNIKNKSDVGDYVYAENAGPHAVTSITGNETDHFQYDASGNQTHADMHIGNTQITRDITYTSFDVPKEIKQTRDGASSVVDFYYDANHSRFMQESFATAEANDSLSLPRAGKMHAATQATKTTTLYLGNEEIDTVTDSTGVHTTTKNYIGDTEITQDENGNKHRYDILKDNIGSTSIITDEQGNVVQRFHYDPFGEQQLISFSKGNVILAKAGIQQNNDIRTSVTRYGFTGQEEVDAGGIDLIHMNGRMYDPHLGRFLSADPSIQDPSNSQCLNRYSYCVNNPICYTDPTGFSWWSHLWKHATHIFHDIGHAIDSVLRNPVVGSLLTIAAGALAVCTLGSGVGALTIMWHFAAAAAVAGGVSYAKTGNLMSGLETAGLTLLSEYAWMGTGALLKNADLIERIGMHGLVGGGLNEIQGGSFKDGFLAAAAGEAMAGPIGMIDQESHDFGAVLARGAAAGIVGGTVAAATGGNFENGAMTGAFAEMFNDQDKNGEGWLAKASNSLMTNVKSWWGNNGYYVEGSFCAVTDGAFGVAEKGVVEAEEVIQEGTKVYRVFGNEAAGWGRYWTNVAPDTVENYRSFAGLPNENSGSFIAEGYLKDLTGIITGPAAPLAGHPGGLFEIFVPNPEKQITIERVSGINPHL